MYFCDFDKSCFYNDVTNLYNLLLPYVNIQPEGYFPVAAYMNLYELTIDRLVFTFSDPTLYSSKIILSKQLYCQMKEYSNDTAAFKMIDYINKLIMQKIKEYQSPKRKKELK